MTLRVAAIMLGFAFASPVLAAGPELHISAKGDIHIIGVELTTINALNLFTVRAWGLRLSLPIEKSTVLEDAGGKAIGAADILQGHKLEIKGIMDPSKNGWVDARLIRDLSIGQPSSSSQAGASAAPAPASVPKPAAAPKAAAPGKRQITKQLSSGSRGSEVIILQEFLQKNGFGIPDDGPVTGFYGKVTVEAVKKFQAANGLAPEGEVGPKTRELVNNLLGKQ